RFSCRTTRPSARCAPRLQPPRLVSGAVQRGEEASPSDSSSLALLALLAVILLQARALPSAATALLGGLRFGLDSRTKAVQLAGDSSSLAVSASTEAPQPTRPLTSRWRSLIVLTSSAPSS